MLTNAKRPNLFLIGAPKCGTTSMTYYFSQHQDVLVSEYKEPHYFCDFGGREISNYCDYIQLFRKVSENHRWLLDASVLYLYLENSVQNIIDFNADARFIVMVRDPLTMVPAWFSQMQGSRHGREEANALEDAWVLIEDRKAGKNIPLGCTEPRILYYDRIAKYAEQLERLFDIVPRDRVHVIVFDDLKKDPRKTFEELCRFLDIRCPHDIDFATLNPRTVWRSPIFSYVFRSRFRPVVRTVLKMAGLKAMSQPIRRLTAKPVAPRQLSRRAAGLVCDCYREDVRALEQLLGRSLNDWLGGAP